METPVNADDVSIRSGGASGPLRINVADEVNAADTNALAVARKEKQSA
jgi:hypothetical protein